MADLAMNDDNELLKNGLRNSKSKYNSALSKISDVKKELEAVNEILKNKDNFNGIDSVDKAIKDIDNSIDRLNDTVMNINRAISSCNVKISNLDET